MVTTNNTDMLITKYATDGTVLWQVQYDHTNNNRDYGVAVAIDASDDIYVAGTSIASSGNGYDWVIQKYDDGGTLIWEEQYNGPGSSYDVPTDMVLDGAGALYVVGASYGTTSLSDYCTRKYSASNGTFIWEARYDYTSLLDIPAAITLGSNSRIYVTGGSASSYTNWDFATVKYNATTGAQVTVTRNSSSGLGLDHPTALAKDQYDNIYVTGAAMSGSQFDIKTVKLDDELNTVWSVTWDNVALDDQANSIGVDANGYVYITGYTKKINGGSDFITIKYNGSGTLQWEKFYSAPDETKGATARKLDIDPYGEILVTGDVYNISNKDFLTLAYNANGDIKWEEWFVGIGGGDDIPMAVKVGIDNLVYVTGRVWTGTQYSYLTVKYEMIDYITPPDSEPSANGFTYYPNKGQLIDDQGDLRNDLKFYNRSDYPELYFSNSKVHFQFNKNDTISSNPDTSFRFEMQFHSNLSGSKIYAAGKLHEGYLNYFKPHCGDGITGIKGTERLLLKEIYRFVDVLFYGNSKGLKYDFICNPGSSVPSIVMNFPGATSLSIVSGQLNILTPLGTVSFIAPSAYQLDANGNVVTLAWTPQYQSAGGNKISFSIGSYNTSLPLIIKMQKGYSTTMTDDCPLNCEWSTFYEGTDDYFDNTNTDAFGNVYVIGHTFNNDFAFTPNVVQTSLKGYADAVALKFDIQGHNIWSTFYGGDGVGYGGFDTGRAIDVDQDGNVIIVGYTDSENLQFVDDLTAGSFQQHIYGGGANDGFIAKFDQFAEQKLWAQYFGGINSDGVYDVKVDDGNNIYIVGPGWDMPIDGTGAYVSTTGRGYIQKFTSHWVPVWGTTLGDYSTIEKVPRSIDVYSGGIYVGGAISGSDLPGSSNSYTGGTQDAFIIGFNATTYGINWSKYLGGNNRDGAFDLVYVKPYVYLTGYTNSTASTFPETDLTGSLDYFDGTFNNTGSLYDIFIARFDASSGGMDWCTYYGGSSDESGTSICAGSDENYQDVIFITGRTSSLNFPFPTSNLPNAYDDQSINFGDTRTYLLMFDKNLTNKWVTLFGANNDIGTGVSTFSNQKLYLGGYTTSASAFPFDDGTNVPYGSAIPYYWDTYQGVDGFITRFDLSSVLVGINEIATSEGNFEVFPNPSNGAFEVRSNMLVGYDNFTICDILGRKLFEKEICEIHNNSIPVELLNFEKGLYLLRINSNVSSETIKIVIQ